MSGLFVLSILICFLFICGAQPFLIADQLSGRNRKPLNLVCYTHGLNMELDLQSLFGPHVHSCTHWLRPRNPPPPPAFRRSCQGVHGSAFLTSGGRRNFLKNIRNSAVFFAVKIPGIPRNSGEFRLYLHTEFRM